LLNRFGDKETVIKSGYREDTEGENKKAASYGRARYRQSCEPDTEDIRSLIQGDGTPSDVAHSSQLSADDSNIRPSPSEVKG
jgi:hypothetical protein